MSRKKPKQFSPEFKLNVILEGYATGNFSEVEAKHGIHMTQISNWKKQLLRQGSDIFKRKNDQKSTE